MSKNPGPARWIRSRDHRVPQATQPTALRCLNDGQHVAPHWGQSWGNETAAGPWRSISRAPPCMLAEWGLAAPFAGIEKGRKSRRRMGRLPPACGILIAGCADRPSPGDQESLRPSARPFVGLHADQRAASAHPLFIHFGLFMRDAGLDERADDTTCRRASRCACQGRC